MLQQEYFCFSAGNNVSVEQTIEFLDICTRHGGGGNGVIGHRSKSSSHGQGGLIDIHIGRKYAR